jgi:peptide-methionine (R)-S-oxide reductase
MRLRRSARTGETVNKSDEEWRRQLTPDQFRVLRRAGTERPFSSDLADVHADGTYRCAACDAALFSSETKFESGTGWPSFFAPAGDGAVSRHRDVGLAGLRTEVRCSSCGSHLGHVFRDGPRPTGQRYCINGCALRLDRDAEAAGSS